MSRTSDALEASRKWIKVKSQLAKQRRVGAALARALVRRVQHHREDESAGDAFFDDDGASLTMLVDATVKFVLSGCEADYAAVVLYGPHGDRDPPVLARWAYANEMETEEDPAWTGGVHTFTARGPSPLDDHLRRSTSAEEEGGPDAAARARVRGFQCATEEITLQQSVRDCFRSGKPAIARGSRRTIDLARVARPVAVPRNT